MNTETLTQLCKRVRANILTSTTAAGSGHPTSSFSATELMTTLFFGGFLKQDIANPTDLANDKVIFSKGHAAPLLYALYEVAGGITEKELLSLRKFTSNIEGHPTPRLPFVDVATGSLGQGLSVGLGMALGLAKQKQTTKQKAPHQHIYMLLGDSELVEGQVWEALQLASYYNTASLVGILDVNKLGQRGETMLGWDLKTYERRISAFGWHTIVLPDGHDIAAITNAYHNLSPTKPTMIIAKTSKGKGVSFLEDKDGLHGKALPQDKLKQALKELGTIDTEKNADVSKPTFSLHIPVVSPASLSSPTYTHSDAIATREAYGDALVTLGENYPTSVVLDAETSNSTHTEKFGKKYPDRFYEMYIAEQNMVSAAVGIAKTGYIPYVSTFAAFLTRAFDQIRMAQYSEANIKIVGSHAGVSIGADGSSQMGLEDIAMMRSILEAVVLYPSDAVSTYKLVYAIAQHTGISYLRLTREKTSVLYDNEEEFVIGGSKILKQSDKDQAVIIAAGITVHEALTAHEQLAKKDISVAVVDAYSIKPLDVQTIHHLAKKTQHVIVVEDHYPAGGLGDAVQSALMELVPLKYTHLAVKQIPRSGEPQELLHFAQIDADAIVNAII